MRLTLIRVGGIAAAVQGAGLLALTVYFGVLFPGEGVATMDDFADPSKYLPVVVAHPSWFTVPAWGLGLFADTLFLAALVAIRRRFARLAPDWIDLATLAGAVGIVLYLVGHAVNVRWAPELIDEVARTGVVSPEIAARYTVLSRIYGAAMLGGSLLTGIALVVLGAIIVRTRVYPRALGWLGIAAGLCDVAIVVALLPPALPLTGAFLMWLGVAMWRDRDPIT